MTTGAFSGGRFCQYKLREEERSLRRGGRRIAPRNSVGGFAWLFKSVYIYTQIEVFRENSNLFPEVARSRCRDLFFSKYYAFAMVFIDVLSSRMHGVRAQAGRNSNNIGSIIDHGKGRTSAFRSFANQVAMLLNIQRLLDLRADQTQDVPSPHAWHPAKQGSADICLINSLSTKP